MATPDTKTPPLPVILVLERPNKLAMTIGLRPGDVLVSVDGRPPRRIAKRRGKPIVQRAVLGFRRDAEHWFVVGRYPDLGRWQAAEAHPETPEAPPSPAKATNWEVWATPDGDYDTLRMQPGLGEALVPFHLTKMRLWEALALWSTLLVLSMMLGWLLGGLVQLCAWLLFWRIAPALARREFVAEGLAPSRILAASSERALHRDVARLMPHLRFRHGARIPAAVEV